MIDCADRTYRRVRPKRRRRRHGDSGPLLWKNNPEHLARIAVHTGRVQAELVNHPETSVVQIARSEASVDRRTLLAYLGERGGQVPRRWIAPDLGWDYCRTARAAKGGWFARQRSQLGLTEVGWEELARIEERRKSL